MKKGKGIIALSMMVIVISCIGMAFVNTMNMSNANRAENERIEFKIKAPASDKGIECLEYDAVFDTDYFRNSSKEFNMGLANISVRMAIGAATTSESYAKYGNNLPNISYVKDNTIDYSVSRNGYLTEAYKNMGFKKDVYYKYEKSLNDASDTVAHGIAMKDIYIDGKKYTLVNVAIRSSSYGSEWASNFRLRNKNGMTGFEVAGKEVYEHLLKYLKNYRINRDNTKIWISGFSRGGAVANLAASYISRACESNIIKTSRDNVYAYTFATPNGKYDPTESEVNKDIYDNIINVVYENDIVATVAPKSWGFRRYGKEYVIPSIYIKSRDLKKIESKKSINFSNVSQEDIEAVKAISYDYMKIRYGCSNEYNEHKYEMFKGFSTSNEFLSLVDSLFSVFGNTVRSYENNWQGALTDILPFVIKKDKKYDGAKRQWVAYSDLKEYIVEKHGQEVLDKAIETGVYSEEEHEKRIENLHKLEETTAISKETEELVESVIDTYYGMRVTAVNYNITENDIKDVSNRLYNKCDEIISKAFPLSGSINCVKNHSAEFYVSYMKNYDVGTGQFIGIE